MFSQSLGLFFLTVGQNDFGNKIQFHDINWKDKIINERNYSTTLFVIESAPKKQYQFRDAIHLHNGSGNVLTKTIIRMGV